MGGQNERAQLDISIGYDVADQLKLSLDGLNVTGEDAQASFAPINYNNGFQDQGVIYVVGARYKF
ncbi:MAG: outer membrane receptor protein involved in Fe transport [Arenicella sp.]